MLQTNDRNRIVLGILCNKCALRGRLKQLKSDVCSTRKCGNQDSFLSFLEIIVSTVEEMQTWQ